MKGMFSPELEKLIEITLTDGMLTDQEKAVLVNAAQKEGVDMNQLDVYIQYLLYQRKEEGIKQAEAKRASETVGGEVKRCPNCGAAYIPGSLVCACGHMFDVTVQSNAYKKFADEVQKKINAIKPYDELNPLKAYGALISKALSGGGKNMKIVAIQQFISSYPVPNNRIDLLEFLSNLPSVANPRAHKESVRNYEDNFDFGYYYWELFTSCINKAKVYFSDDKAFQPSFERHKEMSTQKKGLFSKLFG